MHVACYKFGLNVNITMYCFLLLAFAETPRTGFTAGQTQPMPSGKDVINTKENKRISLQRGNIADEKVFHFLIICYTLLATLCICELKMVGQSYRSY